MTFPIVTKVAETLYNAGLQAIIVAGRHNFYDAKNETMVIVDVQELDTVGYFSDDGVDNAVKMQGILILEFRGQYAYSVLADFLTLRNTDKFRKNLNDVEIFLKGNVTNMRDLKGTQFYDRYLFSTTCRFFVFEKRPEGFISNIGKTHLFKEA